MPRLDYLAAAITGLAGVSQAFLLPPSIAASSVSVAPSMDRILTDTLHHAEELSVAITCPGCPVPANMLNRVAEKPESILRLNMSFSHEQEVDRLLANGVSIYPSDIGLGILPPALLVDQLVKTPSGWEFTGSYLASYTLTTIRPAPSNPKQPLRVVQTSLNIMSVNGQNVDVPNLTVRLLEAPDGALMLDDASLTPSTPANGCTSFICAWKAYIKDKFSKPKGCSGMHRPHHGAIGSTAGPGRTHHRPHFFHSHHHHHKHTGFMKFLHVAVVRVLLPVMLGVVIGATASVVGIVVGHIVIFIWRTLFRRGQRQAYSRIQLDDTNEGDVEEESKSLVQNQDAPPVYEDAPGYEEAVISEKASE